MPELSASHSPAMATETPSPGGARPVLRVALVNSMADAALAITEQRFARLLRAAFPQATIELCCVTPPQIMRGEMAAARIAKHYAAPESLFDAPPDAVIFSGAEPLAENLRGEIFWPCLASLFDWTRAARIPTLFSCLAAHAAVLHFSGITRVRLPRKAFGLFSQVQVVEHPLLAGTPSHFTVAHSRWNALRASDLADGGYTVLTRAHSGGRSGEVDMFVPSDGAPMLFLQGHPEYETSALEGEYRRDMRRFLNGETTVRPDLPAHENPGAWAPHENPGAWAPHESPGAWAPSENPATAPSLSDFAPVLRNFIALKKEMVA